MPPVGLAIPINDPISTARLELTQVEVRLSKHPDRERELEVRVRDRTRLVEHTLNRLLRPRAVLHMPTHQRTRDVSVKLYEGIGYE